MWTNEKKQRNIWDNCRGYLCRRGSWNENGDGKGAGWELSIGEDRISYIRGRREGDEAALRGARIERIRVGRWKESG